MPISSRTRTILFAAATVLNVAAAVTTVMVTAQAFTLASQLRADFKAGAEEIGRMGATVLESVRRVEDSVNAARSSLPSLPSLRR
jgi:hypothetical protein